MLQPFDWAVLTKEEAVILIAFIDKTLGARNYKALQEAGMMQIYSALKKFVEQSDHYEHHVSDFQPSDYKRNDD